MATTVLVASAAIFVMVNIDGGFQLSDSHRCQLSYVPAMNLLRRRKEA